MDGDAKGAGDGETRGGADVGGDCVLEWFCGEVWVDGGEVLGGEEAEEGVAERGEELVCLGGGEFRTAV